MLGRGERREASLNGREEKEYRYTLWSGGKERRWNHSDCTLKKKCISKIKREKSKRENIERKRINTRPQTSPSKGKQWGQTTGAASFRPSNLWKAVCSWWESRSVLRLGQWWACASQGSTCPSCLRLRISAFIVHQEPLWPQLALYM